MQEQLSRVPEDWSVYSDPQSEYRLRYPPGWVVRQEGSQRTLFLDPQSQVQFSIQLLPADADPYQVPHLNVYLLREYTRRIGQYQAVVREFRDTISNNVESRAVLTVGGKSYQLIWHRPKRSGAAGSDTTFDVLLSTLEFLTEEHNP